ncbi:RagB/SusD family nutrient uptake outer membrane protein [Dyadobacter subterraneus]|uniref:RagB/SusD family nutrient uptake outer membrane protein n=1 Tax=Dyadobacter subterraneus TaxID=2773304 RepID=A0ABR9W9P0_9BACT|nr:RagB/SusD family nutrient uptake outer membrane protein [Dyadobacter subterraneus]MBE9462123.1 RagB/SusD family nutrient uptake outer membrane protein [Dyadobacter subterraneus]
MKAKYFYLLLILVLGGTLPGCESDFLDEKPRKSLLVPTSLEDFQALLDNGLQLMNTVPYHTLLADGDFKLTDAYYLSQSQLNRDTYSWSDQAQRTLPGWDTPYKQIFNCNVALDGLSQLGKDQQQSQDYAQLKAAALFYRASAFYQLALQFAPGYIAGGENSAPGIVLPLRADVDQQLGRSTVKETYDRILADLTLAESSLPAVAAYLSRPGKPAALALLARVYLTMQDYSQALSYAEQCLGLKGGLLDYNTLTATSAAPFPLAFNQGNTELLVFSEMRSSLLGNAAITVDSSLYNSYQPGDLRKVLYFNSSRNFKGSYTGTLYPFAGLATDEVYLVKAECQARLGKTDQAMQTLNALLEKRWAKKDFKPLSAASARQALEIILLERRKELLGRGIRWADLKRLNQDPAFAVTLSRTISGKNYVLAPGSQRYQFKIPEDQVSFGVVAQNP